MGAMKNWLGAIVVLGVLGAWVASSSDVILAPVYEFAGGSSDLNASVSRSADHVPDDLVVFDDTVLGTRGQVAVGTNGSHHWVDDVLSGYSFDVGGGALSIGPLITNNETCAASAYDGTSPVVTLFGAVSGRELAISVDSVPQLNYEVDRLIERGLRGGEIESGDQLQIIDVVVPATQQPVHLALLSTVDDLVWSFHFEQGATLAGVSLIGGTAGGVLNLPDGIALEVITKREMETCYRPVMVQTFFPLQGDGHTHIDRAARPITAEQLQQAAAGVARNGSDYRKFQFETWFISQFGINPREEIAGYPNAQVLVAGPAPVAPVVWTPPQGGLLRLIDGMIYITGDTSERDAAWTDLVRRTADQRTGTSLPQPNPEG